MARNRYTCSICGFSDEYIKPAAAPRPKHCGRRMDWTPESAPHVGSLGWTVDLGRDGIHHLASIQDANRLERESLQRERNGEGQPYIFRALHQNRSNRDVPVLEDGPGLPASYHTTRGHKLTPRAAPVPADAFSEE